ncbi:MAG: tetratricopeptide repeat protein [Nibricoccus sp.]
MKRVKVKIYRLERLDAIFRRFTFVPSVVIALVLILTYANTFNVPFLFDDILSIPNNPSIRSLKTALFPPGELGLTVGGRPILNLTFALNYLIGGNNLVVLHITNLAIHLLVALLIQGSIRRVLSLPLFDERFRSHAATVAFCTALLWGTHPLQTESVTYIVQRAESFSSLLYVLTLYCFIRSGIDGGKDSQWWLVGSVTTCFLGMGTKETMASAPIFVLLFDRAFVSGSFAQAWRARKWYYVGLASTWLFIVYCVLGAGGRATTAGFQLGIAWWDYLLTQCFAQGRYFRLFLLPFGQIFDYGRPLVSEASSIAFPGLAVIAASFLSLYALVKRPRIGILGFGYFAVHAPTLLIPVVTQTIAEHRMYFPLGLLIFAFVLVIYGRFGQRAVPYFLAVSLAWGITSFLRNRDYSTIDRLWLDTVSKVPQNSRAWHSIGQQQMARKEWTAAEETLKRALTLRPNDFLVKQDLATVLIALGKMEEASACYRDILASLPKDFNQIYKIREDLALLLEQTAHFDEAIDELAKALEESPEKKRLRLVIGHVMARGGRRTDAKRLFYAVTSENSKCEDSWIEYASALMEMGEPLAAVELLHEAEKILPGSLELRRALGVALQTAGRNEESISILTECIQRKPNWGEALFNLGVSKLNLRQGEEAEKYFFAAEMNGVFTPALQAAWGRAALGQGREQEAIRRLTKAVDSMVMDWENRYILANLLLSHGAAEKAVGHYEKVIARRPNHVNAHNELGVAYLELGRKADARREFETTLKLQPSNEDALANLKDLDAQP